MPLSPQGSPDSMTQFRITTTKFRQAPCIRKAARRSSTYVGLSAVGHRVTSSMGLLHNALGLRLHCHSIARSCDSNWLPHRSPDARVCAIGSRIFVPPCARVQARFPHAECRHVLTSAAASQRHPRRFPTPFPYRAWRPPCRIEARLVPSRRRLALASGDGFEWRLELWEG